MSSSGDQPPLFEVLWGRQRGLCWICCKPMQRKSGSPWMATFDHIQPLSCGGANRPNNKLLAHQICNQVRGRKQPYVKVSAVITRALNRIHEAAKRRTFSG